MTPNHSFYVPFVEEADRTLMRHLTAMLVIVTTLFAGAVELHRFYSQKFHDTTAPAKWIWCRTRMSRGSALAFFATREFDLPPNRNYTKIKIAADPQYTLYFNGREIAGRETAGERTVDVYDVSALARDGRNRIVVAMRSANGVGGLLVSVDITRELENFVVTDDRWRIATAWAPGLPLRDPRSTEPPMIIGEPPVGRWNFPGSRRGEFTTTSGTTLAPREAAAYIARLPEVKVISGVAVASSRRVRATAFDFGPVRGHAKLTMKYVPPFSRLVNVRFANVREELFHLEGTTHPFVFAAGERTLIDPRLRSFRYIIVYGGEANAEVVREPASQ